MGYIFVVTDVNHDIIIAFTTYDAAVDYVKLMKDGQNADYYPHDINIHISKITLHTEAI